jgi:hypothetical protein
MKSLNFNAVTVWVEDECLSDLIGGIIVCGYFDGDPGCVKAFDLFFHLGGDQGEQKAPWRVNVLWAFANTHISISSDAINAAIALVEDEVETKKFMVEAVTAIKVEDVDKRDLLVPALHDELLPYG